MKRIRKCHGTIQNKDENISKAEHQHFMIRFEDLVASGPAILRYLMTRCIKS